MFGPFLKPRGVPFVPPPQIRRLPLSLMRTALVTRQPELVQEGVEQYQRLMAEDRERAPMLPQRMLFQQWKSDLSEDGLNRPGFRRATSSVESYVRVSGAIENLQPRVKQPTMTYDEAVAAAARGALHFPQSPELHEPAPVISRDVPEHGKRDMPPPSAYAATHVAVEVRAAGQRVNATSRALQSAAAARTRAVAMIREGR